MKKTATWILIGFIAGLLTLPCLAADEMAAPALPAYLIQPGDQLGLSVWREEELSTGAIVLPDGTASFPLVGRVTVAGRTVSDVEKEIVERLAVYIPDPVVTVRLGQLGGNQIYVIGKVARPGVFQVSRYVDVMQALTMAGGITPFAAANKIKILRREGGAETVIGFRFGDVEKGENLGQNIILQSGDVIVVP